MFDYLLIIYIYVPTYLPNEISDFRLNNNINVVGILKENIPIIENELLIIIRYGSCSCYRVIRKNNYKELFSSSVLVSSRYLLVTKHNKYYIF